jgi:hypothetical protein
VEKRPFSLFDFILVEILSISKTTLRSCGYALHIMMMTKKITGIDFVKGMEITDLKPQFPTAPGISMDVLFGCSMHHSFRYGGTSSSTGSILRVFKSLFCMCRDTCQRQDMLLSNQCR